MKQQLFLIAAAALSSFQCTAREVTPRNLQILAQKWNIDDPTFNHGGVSFDMDYLVSDFVLDTMTDYSIWDVGCEEGGYPLSNDIINVVKSTQPGFVQNAAGTGNRMIELDLKLVSDEIVKEPRIFTDVVIDGEAKAVVEFCVRFKLTTPGLVAEVNFLESLVTLYVDLTDGFSIGNLIVSPKIVAVETANQGYEVDVFFCDLDGNPFSEEEASAPRFPGAELKICVVPTQQSLDEGVLMDAIESFYFFRIDERGNKMVQDVIVNRTMASNGLAAGLNCDAGTHCEFSSLVKADFYQETFGSDMPTAAPTKFNEFEYCSQFSDAEVLNVDSSSVVYTEVAPLYNTVVAGRAIQFNDDAQTCTTAANPSCFTSNHPSCTASGTVDESLGYTMNFDGSTATAPGGCCTANSCAGVFLATQQSNLLAGDKFSYTYKATGGGDWYEAAIVLYEGLPPATDNTNIVDARVVRGASISDFKTESFTVPADGTYFLGFFTASYDASGGGALGANMQVLAFSYTGGAPPLPGDPTSAPTVSPDPNFVIPAFCDQYLARRRLDGEQQQPPLPSQHHTEERPRRGLQAGITVQGEGIATLKFPGSPQAPPSGRRGLGAPEQEYYYYEEERDLQEEGAQGAEISFQFSVIDGEPEPRLSSASSTASVLFTMFMSLLAGALNAYLLV